ncbi:putative fimbrial outer membrane usher protein SthC [Serratia fonticola]|uniref:Putative fimbrial outer membrane usher protein SthC n=1 Tax=Serratia fonticola TaxID=47917 RepID=A0A4U9UX11_SERFO|nr:putative fimbrial outer membrane usher protein SthC [Serratia fonticola]
MGQRPEDAIPWVVGYSNNWQGVSYGINYSQNKNAASSNGTRSEATDRVLALNVNIPLNHWMGNTWANYAMSNTKGARPRITSVSAAQRWTITT